jgi:hypothetical protein
MDGYLYYSSNPLKINKRLLQKQMKEYTSDSQIENFFGSGFSKNILKYSDIEDYKTIDQLLPSKRNFKIILLESSYNSGHWVCILKYGDTIEYFNSYGLRPSAELDSNTDLVNKQLEQDTKYLNILLNKAMDKYNIIYNKRKFQEVSSDVATCGSWTIVRGVLFKKADMDLYDFISFIDQATKAFRLTGDELVTLLVNFKK